MYSRLLRSNYAFSLFSFVFDEATVTFWPYARARREGERAQGGTNILRERAEADGAGGFGASTLLVIAGPESKEEAAAATMELITNRTCTARWRAASHRSRLATSASSSGCSCSAAET